MNATTTNAPVRWSRSDFTPDQLAELAGFTSPVPISANSRDGILLRSVRDELVDQVIDHPEILTDNAARLTALTDNARHVMAVLKSTSDQEDAFIIGLFYALVCGMQDGSLEIPR